MMRLLSLLIFGVSLQLLNVCAQSAAVMRNEGAAGKTPRVALLVDEPNLESLLIAGFSGVETQGRAELPKIAAERLLAGGRLELSGAEIALVVERSGERGVVRIVECATGATVVALELPKMPVEETARWVVARTRPFLGEAADATRPKISLTGLRFVTDSAESRSAERALNLMLTARLQARGAVVLERWRMGDLVFEKSLHANESPFWGAAHVVDGSVTATGGKLIARVRIRDAAGAETLVTAEGGTEESLADAIVERVLAGKGTVGDAGRRQTEADMFVAEAKWMLEHGLPREAWQATESALALGMKSRREADMLRVKAAAMCAYPDDLKTTLLRDGHYRAKAFALSELPVRVAAATEALLLAGDYCNAYSKEEIPREALEHPAVLGVRSLYSGLRVLRTAHDSGWAEANWDAVRGLREAIRRSADFLQSGTVPLGRQRLMFFINLANYAGYWSETPAEAIAFYRVVLNPDFEGGVSAWPEVIRSELSYGALAYGSIPRPPFLTGTATVKEFPSGIGGWRVPGRDEGAARAVWGAFIDELDRSPHVLHQADGLALRWQSTADKRARLALTARIADFISEHVKELAGPLGSAIFVQLVEPLRDVNRSGELAVAQEKVVGAFLSLIRSDSSVSPVIIEHIQTLFSYGQTNVREDQGKALLAALDARRARPSLARRDLRGIDSARASIWKKFPALHPTGNAEDALVVQSLWIAKEHGPGAPDKQVGFAEGTAVWSNAHLWVLDARGGALWKINVRSGGTTIITPENWPTRSYKNNESYVVFKSQLVPWGGKFAITLEGGVWVLDEMQKQWEKLDLPSARYWIGVAHGDLWAVSGELVHAGSVKQTEGSALYRISPELTCELVASSRRRPPVHPLDSVLAGAPFLVSPSRKGGVIIGTYRYDESFTFFDSGSADIPSRSGERFVESLKVTGSPGLVMRRRYPGGDRSRPSRIELFDSESDELLVAHPELNHPGRARFPYPAELENLPASEYAATWRDGGLDVLAWSSLGSPWGVSEAWLTRIDAEGSTVYPLRFAWSADADQRVRTAGLDAKVFRYPWPDAKGLITTDQGLVITGSAMSGFWFIPNEDLDRRRGVVVAPPQR